MEGITLWGCWSLALVVAPAVALTRTRLDIIIRRCAGGGLLHWPRSTGDSFVRTRCRSRHSVHVEILLAAQVPGTHVMWVSLHCVNRPRMHLHMPVNCMGFHLFDGRFKVLDWLSPPFWVVLARNSNSRGDILRLGLERP